VKKKKVSKERMKERIKQTSKVVGQTYEKVKTQLEKEGKIEDIKEEIRINKAYRVLKDNANFIERVVLPGEK